ncbi:Type I inositol-1,4,5-trisphosphate 5-phosphatase [Gryllus bimaculatus]|nr:Type I inositol-1,4,5-trisphosphate 5-phosphatase [Gryllus bimaculatus]
MAGKTTPVLLVTANVGSIFEDPSHMLKIWTEEFLSTVARLDPKFIALHCQEVGGKNYERSMKHVEDFVRLFMSSEELRLFDKVRVFLDEDYSSAENFTALGNFYFIHESLCDVLIWDFAAMTFVPAKGKEVHSGNIEAVTTKEKSKFPQDFFPECKWSRKGFLRTRWSLNGTVFDLINIHLFHDASNFIAMESFPSVYSKNRRRALEHTLERFHNDSYGTAPFFVFGDFNFRTDTQGVINKLADGLNPVRVQSNKSNDHTKLQYKDDESQVVLSLGKKEFSHADHQSIFLDENGMWLKEFDREMEAFTGRLFEFAIAFPPSYPFEEEEKGGNNYMKTRCPAWCDRVILSNTAKTLVNNASDPDSVEYGLMGPNTRMGDHKPVYLKMDLINDAGTVSCCTSCDTSSSDERVLCFGNVAVCEPASWSCSSLSLKQGGSAPSTALTLKLDTSAAALTADCFLAPPHASLLHEPYTPESMETPSSSPIPVRIQRDFGEVEGVQWKCADDEEVSECDVIKNLHTDLSKRISDSNILTSNSLREESSVIQDMSFCKQIISVCDYDLTSKESNKKSGTDTTGQCETSHQGVPHVFVCYSDTQVQKLQDTNSLDQTSDSQVTKNNVLENIKIIPKENSFVKRFQIEHEMENEITYKSCDMIAQENRNELSSLTSSESRIKEKDSVFQQNLLSSLLLKTFSSDSGIQPTTSSTSSIPSLSSQSLKKECIDMDIVCPKILEKKVSDVLPVNEFVANISSGLIVSDPKEKEDTSESISVANHINLYRSLNACGNESKWVLEDTKNYTFSKQNVRSVPVSTNNCSEIDENKGFFTEPGIMNELSEREKNVHLSVCPETVNDINVNCHVDEKLNFPVNSQDCINISTDVSSQLRSTKEQRPKCTKNHKLRTNSKNCCSSCCTII